MSTDIEPYTRSTDGATMLAVAPGEFVNQALLAKLRIVPLRMVTEQKEIAATEQKETTAPEAET